MLDVASSVNEQRPWNIENIPVNEVKVDPKLKGPGRSDLE